MHVLPRPFPMRRMRSANFHTRLPQVSSSCNPRQVLSRPCLRAMSGSEVELDDISATSDPLSDDSSHEDASSGSEDDAEDSDSPPSSWEARLCCRASHPQLQSNHRSPKEKFSSGFSFRSSYQNRPHERKGLRQPRPRLHWQHETPFVQRKTRVGGHLTFDFLS